MVLFAACERDEIIDDSKSDLGLETVSIKEAKAILSEFKPLQTRANSTSDSYKKFLPDVVPDLTNITQQEITNSNELLTVVPVKNNTSKVFSRVLFLKIDNELIKKSFILYPTKKCAENPALFSGIIILTELDKEFHSGYRVKDGNIVSELFLKKEIKTRSTNHKVDIISLMEDEKDDLYFGWLDEVIIREKRGGGSQRRNYWNTFSFINRNRSSSIQPRTSNWNYNKDYEKSVHPGGKGAKNSSKGKNNFKKNIHYKKLNKCLTSVLEDLINANKVDLKQIIEKSMNKKVPKGYEWTLGMDKSKISKGANATTSRQNGNVETHFDWNKLQNASDLSVARTMIHEAVHAFLVNEMKHDRKNLATNYPKMLEVHKKFQNTDIAHHAQMGATFINVIAKGLMAYGQSRGYNYKLSFYQDLSWGGLRYYRNKSGKIVMSDIYKATVPNQSDRNRIEKAIANEYIRSTNSKGGEPCK